MLIKVGRFFFVCFPLLKPFNAAWLDIFYFEKLEFLIITDDCSNFIVTRELKSKFITAIHQTLEAVFNDFSIRPNFIGSDSEFNFDALKDHFPNYRKSFPYRHQGNKAENACRVLKRMIRLLATKFDVAFSLQKVVTEAVFLHNTNYKRHLKSAPVQLLYSSSEEELAQSYKSRLAQQERDFKKQQSKKFQKIEEDDIVIRRDHSPNTQQIFHPTFYVVKKLEATHAIICPYGSNETLKASLRDLKKFFLMIQKFLKMFQKFLKMFLNKNIFKSKAQMTN